MAVFGSSFTATTLKLLKKARAPLDTRVEHYHNCASSSNLKRA